MDLVTSEEFLALSFNDIYEIVEWDDLHVVSEEKARNRAYV